MKRVKKIFIKDRISKLIPVKGLNIKVSRNIFNSIIDDKNRFNREQYNY